MKAPTRTLVVILVLLAATPPSARAAAVDEAEAAALADHWFRQEVSGFAKLTDDAKDQAIAAMQGRQVLYLVSKDDLVENRPDGQVLAYVVKYRPSGYVIVSGEDRIQPIIAFSATDEFRWDCPELNFGREYLGATLTA